MTLASRNAHKARELEVLPPGWAITENSAPWSSVTMAIRPYGVSPGGRIIEPPAARAAATAASASATAK